MTCGGECVGQGNVNRCLYGLVVHRRYRGATVYPGIARSSDTLVVSNATGSCGVSI